MHAEKGKPGQYVGKVDPDSPAEEAGLREGDRILEVNGVDIGSETHKQVVERIKAIPNETTLLVLDPSPLIQKHNTTNGTSTTTTSPNEMSSSDSNVNNNHQQQQHSRNGHSDGKSNGNSSNGTTSPVKVPASPISDNGITITTTTKIKSTSNGGSPSLSINNNESSSMTMGSNNNNKMMTTPNSMTTTGSNGNHEKNHNGTAMHKSPTLATSKSQGQLNLKMTAAEMRAMLQAKKKYDPKNDTIDLRKKHDIIDQL